MFLDNCEPDKAEYQTLLKLRNRRSCKRLFQSKHWFSTRSSTTSVKLPKVKSAKYGITAQEMSISFGYILAIKLRKIDPLRSMLK